MKIDFIISTLRGGGAERVLTLLANSLSNKDNFKINIITLFEGEDHYDVNPSINRVVLNGSKSLPSHTIRSFTNLFKYYRKKSNRPDIIISFITLTNLIAILVAKLLSIKIIAQEHNSHLRYMKNRKGLTNLTRKYIYNKADLVTVLTSFDIDYYRKYGVNVKVMLNPCTFKPIEDNSHKREKIILAVGNLNRYHHKGFDNLIEFISPILKNNPDWTLRIAGSGDEGLKTLEALVEKHNVEKQIIFVGFISNISELMKKSSIFILPSRFEGLPMVLLEAMSLGMACIAYNCKTGPSDIINNRSNGLLIDDQNKQAMSKGLVELMQNDTLRALLSENGIKSLERYQIDTIVNDYISIFKNITTA